MAMVFSMMVVVAENTPIVSPIHGVVDESQIVFGDIAIAILPHFFSNHAFGFVARTEDAGRLIYNFLEMELFAH